MRISRTKRRVREHEPMPSLERCERITEPFPGWRRQGDDPAAADVRRMDDAFEARPTSRRPALGCDDGAQK